MSTPTTFHAHGQDWYSHTPGDPPPETKRALIFTLWRGELEASHLRQVRPVTPADSVWEKALQGREGFEVIGWRYAATPRGKDELTGAIQKLTTTPVISSESLALIEAAKAVQSGSMTLAEAISKLSLTTSSK